MRIRAKEAFRVLRALLKAFACRIGNEAPFQML